MMLEVGQKMVMLRDGKDCKPWNAFKKGDVVTVDRFDGYDFSVRVVGPFKETTIGQWIGHEDMKPYEEKPMLKVGDKVLVKSGYGLAGRTGVITYGCGEEAFMVGDRDIYGRHQHHLSVDESEFHLFFLDRDLEPYEEKPVFKVGDKVRIKDGGAYSKEVLTVTGIVGPDVSGWPIHTTAPEGERTPWRWREDELELVEEVTDFDVNEMFDTYKATGVDISVTIDGKVYTGTVYPSSKDYDWGYLHGYDEFGERD